jgi:TPR repeat protein
MIRVAIQTVPYLESDEVISKFVEGVKYYLGKDVPRDYQKSLKRFQFGFSKGHSDTEEYLKALHGKGIDILDRYRRALNYCENPNENIDGDSLTYIGLLHYEGIVLPIEQAKALKYFRAGEARWSQELTRMIGDCYFNGYGVDANSEMAFQYYSEAFLRANLQATLSLA